MPTVHLGRSLMGDSRDPDAEDGSDRVQCTSCHDIHLEKHPAMLLKAPRKGSELCLLCHADTHGLIASRHDMTLYAPDAVNIRGELPAESGPCGVCHLMHPLAGTDTFWAQPVLSPEDFGQHVCTGCHSPGGCAAERMVAFADHPQVTLLNRSDPNQAGSMPTFDRRGNLSPTGELACLTCHNAHAAGPRNHMFLRPGTHQQLCIDCHGAEGLWRYLYFHQAGRKPR